MNSRYAVKKRSTRGEGVALPQVCPLEPERPEGVRVLQFSTFRQMQTMRSQGTAGALTLWGMQSSVEKKSAPEAEAKDVSPIAQDHHGAICATSDRCLHRVQGHSNGLG